MNKPRNFVFKIIELHFSYVRFLGLPHQATIHFKLCENMKKILLHSIFHFRLLKASICLLVMLLNGKQILCVQSNQFPYPLLLIHARIALCNHSTFTYNSVEMRLYVCLKWKVYCWLRSMSNIVYIVVDIIIWCLEAASPIGLQTKTASMLHQASFFHTIIKWGYVIIIKILCCWVLGWKHSFQQRLYLKYLYLLMQQC